MSDARKPGRQKSAIKLAWPAGTFVLVRMAGRGNGYGGCVIARTVDEPKLDGSVVITLAAAYREDIGRVAAQRVKVNVRDLVRAETENTKAAIERDIYPERKPIDVKSRSA